MATGRSDSDNFITTARIMLFMKRDESSNIEPFRLGVARPETRQL